MGKDVFANGQEIACKSGDGKVVAAFPDVCLSPPPPPAGPVPVPYPNSSFSRDMREGSKSVTIGGGEVMLRDKSYYQTSPLGNEAATRNFGAGVVSHQISGKTYFAAWSMDVSIEGDLVDRNLDLATSNHGSPSNNPTGTNLSSAGCSDAGGNDQEKCPCCNGDKHANQKGAQQVDEADWYGPEGMKMVEQARALGCECVPATPNSGCGTYFVQRNATQRHKGRSRWESRYKKEFILRYETRHGAEILAGTKTPIAVGSGGSTGEQICHKVPIAAGGCIKGDGNLERKSDMSQECQDLDTTLGERFHDSRTAYWDANPI